MQFSLHLLSEKHGGPFKIIWIAATRGITYANRKDILECNIVEVCDELSKIIENNLSNSSYHCSLSIIARLVNGIVKIYRKKAELMQVEIVNFLIQVRRPCIIVADYNEESQPTPTTPVIRVRQKRKHKDISLGISIPQLLDFVERDIQIDDDQLFKSTTNLAPHELITLPDELPQINLGSRQTEFDDFGIEDFNLAEIPMDIVPVPDMPVPLLPETNFVISPPKAPSIIRHVKPVEIILPVSQKRTSQHLQNITVDNDVPSSKRMCFTRSRAFFEKVNIKNKHRNFVNIDRYDPPIYEFQWWNSNIDSAVHLINSIGSMYIEMPAVFIRRNIDQHSLNQTQRLNVSKPDTLPTLSPSHNQNSTASSSVPLRESFAHNEIVVCAEVHEPPASGTSLAEVSFRREDGSVTAHSINGSIRLFHDYAINPQNISHSGSGDILLEHNYSSNVNNTFNGCDKTEERHRLELIKQVVIGWNEKLKGDLEIDHICKPNLSRSNIAVTFNDLLSLHKMGVVKLNNKPNTLELGIISKGPKLLNKN